MLQCVAVCCSVLQCVAAFCSVLQRFAVWTSEIVEFLAGQAIENVLQCVAVCCSVLQCVAVCCSVLQCVAACCSALQRVAVCCSVLQCTAVRCRVSDRRTQLQGFFSYACAYFHVSCLARRDSENNSLNGLFYTGLFLYIHLFLQLSFHIHAPIFTCHVS